MENETKQIINVENPSVEYIKLIKNTKGYNWEIKQLSLDINALAKLNLEMQNKFAVQE
jgi:hypothetical protein